MTQSWSISNPYTADGKATMLRLGKNMNISCKKRRGKKVTGRECPLSDVLVLRN